MTNLAFAMPDRCPQRCNRMASDLAFEHRKSGWRLLVPFAFPVCVRSSRCTTHRLRTGLCDPPITLTIRHVRIRAPTGTGCWRQPDPSRCGRTRTNRREPGGLAVTCRDRVDAEPEETLPVEPATSLTVRRHDSRWRPVGACAVAATGGDTAVDKIFPCT